jgi:hypothetical protein
MCLLTFCLIIIILAAIALLVDIARLAWGILFLCQQGGSAGVRECEKVALLQAALATQLERLIALVMGMCPDSGVSDHRTQGGDPVG